jgi:glutamine amidotransferase
MDIVVVDLGLGNLRSVEKAVALAAHGLGLAHPQISADPEIIANAKCVINPGQGAFRDGVAALDAGGGALRDCLRAYISSAKPYFGICLGLQLLFESSEEAPGARGLGVVAGRVTKLPTDLHEPSEPNRPLKIPHMGWNQPHLANTEAARIFAPFFESAGNAPWFYFVHSFHGVPVDARWIAATADYGGFEITAAIAKDNIIATQFHPEKSQKAGIALLTSYLRSHV